MAGRGSSFGGASSGRLAPLSPVISLIGRVAMSALFLISGFGKLTNHAGTVEYFTKTGIQAAEAAYYLTICIEVLVALAFLLGWKTRLSALILAGWCIATAMMVHYAPGNAGQMISFWKNVAMAGGFLQFVAWGAGPLSLDKR